MTVTENTSQLDTDPDPGYRREVSGSRLLGRRIANLRRYIPLSFLWFAVAILILIPSLMVLYAASVDGTPRPGSMDREFTLEHFRGVFRGGNFVALRNSLFLGVSATSIALIWGTVLAWISSRTDAPGKWLVRLAGIAPLFISPLVGAFAWTMLASERQGHLNLILRDLGLDFFTFNIYTMGGVIFVMGLYYTPYVFLFVNSAMALANPQLEEAGEVHGANKLGVFRTITVPLAAPAIIGAGVLTFVLVVENFAVVQILAAPAGIATLPGFIYSFMTRMPIAANEAAAIGILMTAMATVAIVFQRRFLKRRQYTTVTGKGFRPREVPLGKLRWLATGLALVYLLLAVGLPFTALAQAAIRSHMFMENAASLVDFSNVSFVRFQEMLDYEPFVTGFRNSMITSVTAGILGGIFYLILSYSVYRTKLPGVRFLEYAAMVPLALPALVISMGFLWTWLLAPIPLYGTLTILVLAYIARFIPQGFRSISSTILSVHQDLEDSAVVAGATRFRATLDVTVPLIKTGVLSTMLLMVILSIRELSAALFLFTSRTRVLSIVVFDHMEAGQTARAATIAILYSSVLLVITVVASKWFGVGKPET